MMPLNGSPIGFLTVAPRRTPPFCVFGTFLIDAHFKNKRGFAMKIPFR